MTSEGLGELFKGDSANMCAGKFPFVLMVGRANGQVCAEGERGQPSVRANIFNNSFEDLMPVLTKINLESNILYLVTEMSD
jgi:hypothetical protein